MCSLSHDLTGWHTNFLTFSLLCMSSGETVVTNGKHMSGDWKSGGSQSVKPGTRVADFVKAGGESYSLPSDNCHHGSKRMMDLGKGI